MIYRIYTDGSARNNGGAKSWGAWGWVCVSQEGDKISGRTTATSNTTNQRMELMAAVEALETTAPLLETLDTIEVYTDSSYLCNCVNQNWYSKWETNGWKTTKRQEVINADLWRRLIPFFRDCRIKFLKVKGHADGSTEHEKWNAYVDNLVQNASAALKDLEVN